MEKIYIRFYYLKTLHYFFFSLGVTSLIFCIMFFNISILGSLSLFFTSILYTLASVYIAHRFYKIYKEAVSLIKVVRIYAPPYIILASWSLGMTIMFLYFSPFIIEFLYAFLFVNYYITFVLVIGFILSRFEFVGKLFDVYSLFTLKNALKIAKKYAYLVDVETYPVGSDQKIDEILENIWSCKKYPVMHVRRLEIALCEKKIDECRNLIESMQKTPEKTPLYEESIKLLKERIADYKKKIEMIKEKID